MGRLRALNIILLAVMIIMSVMHRNERTKMNEIINQLKEDVQGKQLSKEECEKSTLQTIFERKSVRNYKTDPVEKEKLETIVKAGMAAPTARDRRPWEFVIIDDREILDKLAEGLPYAKMAKQASAGIIVAGDLEKQAGGPDSTYWIMDCSAAIQNMLLAVEHLGLGAVWTALYPNQDRIDVAKSVINFPEHIMPLAFIPIGVPVGDETPKDKYNEEQIHWNKW